jgi:hypothetical protein
LQARRSVHWLQEKGTSKKKEFRSVAEGQTTSVVERANRDHPTWIAGSSRASLDRHVMGLT